MRDANLHDLPAEASEPDLLISSARQHDDALFADDVEGLCHCALRTARNVHYRVDATSSRDLTNAFTHVLGLDVDYVVGAESFRHCETLGIPWKRPAHDDPVDARALRGYDASKTHLSGTLDEHGFPRMEFAMKNGPLDTVGHRHEKGRL